jgi:ribosomal protein S7
LRRSLVGEASPNSSKPFSAAAAAEQQQAGREPLTAADKEALEKLVGILTKDGKKSRARRLLLDAMHIIQQQLAQGKGSA